jgi:biopolymer transport protein ExbD
MDFIIWIIMLMLVFFGISALRESPPPVVTVQVPASTSVKMNPDSVLLIQLNGQNVKLRYLEDSIITDNEAVMKSFIKKYRFLDNERILVRGDGNLYYPDFKKVKNAMKANDIYKFRIVTTGN